MLFVSRVGGFTDIPWEAFNVAPGAAPSAPSFLIYIFPTASFIRMLIPVAVTRSCQPICSRPVTAGWHGVANAPLGNRMPSFCHH